MTSSKNFPFHSFGAPGCPINATGNFNENLSLYLEECTEAKESNFVSPIWCTVLFHEKSKSLVPLYTIEENVRSSSSAFTCQHCTHAGWGGHLVSKSRYHLIIPDDDDWIKTLGEDQVLESGRHLLHGVLHSNGYGHLLRINGIEGGSKHLTGRETMELWDRICTNLRTREVSVRDTSKKRSLELRLLHGVSYGHSWFGRWGYRFCGGSYGVTVRRYKKAIEELTSLRVDTVLKDFEGRECHGNIKKIICYYREACESKLLTIKELMKYILLSRPSSFQIGRSGTKIVEKFSDVARRDTTRSTRLEEAAEVIVKVLKGRRNNSGMAQEDVSEAARLRGIRNTELLNHVLSLMDSVVVGDHIVFHTGNPTSGKLEYTIHEVTEPGVNAYTDLSLLYNAILQDNLNSERLKLGVEDVLDSKHFVKEWAPLKSDPEKLTIICNVMLDIGGIGPEREKECPPGVIVQIPVHSTFRDLKEVAETSLRATYCFMEQFVVTAIQDFEQIEDGEMISTLLESGTEIFLKGSRSGMTSPLKYQASEENSNVRCVCGAEDEDGEPVVACQTCNIRYHTRCIDQTVQPFLDDGQRMMACNVCGIRQHTLCVGIGDAEPLPKWYGCPRCSHMVDFAYGHYLNH